MPVDYALRSRRWRVTFTAPDGIARSVSLEEMSPRGAEAAARRQAALLDWSPDWPATVTLDV